MQAHRYRFGLFEFDADRLELRREGVLLRLQAQPAQVLACLLERAGVVVSRDELRKTVWGDATFVDFEAGLNFCISQIRSALRDDSAQPLYIRTVPKSGYQLIAPVERKSEEGEKSTRVSNGALEMAGAVEPGAPALLGHTALVTVILIVLSVAVFLGLRFSGALRDARPPVLAVSRFDNETGDAAMSRFGDALTDDVVEELTARSGGNYRVIGNAQILRLPREQRDLRAIAASLNAGYVVLGQVQTNGEQVRILAHLIRLSDQTHIWVVRQDRSRGDDLRLEAELAPKLQSNSHRGWRSSRKRPAPLRREVTEFLRHSS